MVIVTVSKVKARNNKKQLLLTGEKVEAEIIAVAHPNIVIWPGGQEPPANAFGMHNTTNAKYDEEYHRARVKVRYIDPVTRQEVIRETKLERNDFKSIRIIQIALPGAIRLSSGTMATMKHNQKLFSQYSKSLDDKNLTKERKKELLRQAALTMTAQGNADETGALQDEERYYLLNPPVKAAGYIDGEQIRFFQTDEDVDYLRDWTKDLEQQ